MYQKLTFHLFILGIIIIASTDICARITTLHTEENGFKWYEELRSYQVGSQRWEHDYHVLDVNWKLLIEGTSGIKFHCVDANDKGQFEVQRGKRRKVKELYSPNGECIATKIPDIYKRFRSENKYYYIVVIYEHGSKYGVIDEKGIQILPCKFENLKTELYDGTKLEGCLYVENDSYSKGLIRFDGTYIIPPQNNQRIYSQGPFFEARKSVANSCTLITTSGKILVTDATEIIDNPNKSHLKIIYAEKNIGLLDYNGNWILSPDLGFSDFDEIQGPANQTFYKVRNAKNKLYGIVNNGMKEVFSCEFEQIEYIGGDFFKFKSGDAWGVIDLKENYNPHLTKLFKHRSIFYDSKNHSIYKTRLYRRM